MAQKMKVKLPRTSVQQKCILFLNETILKLNWFSFTNTDSFWKRKHQNNPTLIVKNLQKPI